MLLVSKWSYLLLLSLSIAEATSGEDTELDPDSDSVDRTDADSVDRTDADSVDRTDADSADRTDADSVDRTDADSVDRTDADSADRTDADSVDRTDADSVDRTDADSVDRTDADNVDRTDADSVDRTDADSVDRTDADSVDRTDADSVDRTDADSVDRTDAASVDRTDAASRDRTDADRVGRTDADRVGRTDADRVGRTDADICKNNQNVSQNIERIIDRKLFKLQHQLTERFENITGLMYDVKRDVKRIVENKAVQQAINITTPVSALKGKTILDALSLIPELEENIRNLLNVSENIKTSVAKTNQKLNVLEYNATEPRKCDLNRDRSLETNILEQITNISNAIKDPEYEEKTILKSIENIINNRLDAMETTWRKNITETLETLENKRNREIRESVEKIVVDEITNMNKQISDKIDSAIKEKQILESIEKINQKLAVLDNIPRLERQIQNILNNNITNITQQSNATTNNGSVDSVTNAPESGNDTNNSFCNIDVPRSVQINDDIWKERQIPAEDGLDRFILSKTGCTRRALQYERFFTLPFASPYNGELYEWRGAVRARGAAYVGVEWSPANDYWSPGNGYGFVVGENENTNTKLYKRRPWRELRRQSTPRILSVDRYTPLYIKIQNGIMTFGKQCDREPIFTRNVDITRGDLVTITFWPKSLTGAMYLHRCPARLR